MNKKRLLKLADFLETVPEKNFYIGSWVSQKAIKPEGDRPGDCGFAGCAVGWAAHAKLVPGLEVVTQRGSLSMRPHYVTGGTPRNSYYGSEAAQRAFGLSEGAADQLFMPSSYAVFNPTPKQVAKRIRKFVELGHV